MVKLAYDQIEARINKDEIVSFLQDKINELPTRASYAVSAMLSAFEWAEQEEIPVLTGKAKDNITSVLESPLSGIVFNAVDYDVFIIEPTAPHWIGSPVYIMNIGWRYIGMHPGTPGNDYPQRAYDSQQGTVDNILNELLDWMVA